MKSRLPSNAIQLTLRDAVGSIYTKLCQVVTNGNGLFHFFLGVDEYQNIENIGRAPRNHMNPTILRELVSTV